MMNTLKKYQTCGERNKSMMQNYQAWAEVEEYKTLGAKGNEDLALGQNQGVIPKGGTPSTRTCYPAQHRGISDIKWK